MRQLFYSCSILVKFGLIVALILVVGCSTTIRTPVLTEQEIDAESSEQLRSTILRRQGHEQKILDLIWPLRVANTQICPGHAGMTLGFGWKTPPKQQRGRSLEIQVVNEVYDFRGHAVISKIATGSPAEVAGIKVGDRITSIGEWSIQEDKSQKFNRLVASRLGKLKSKGAVTLGIWRGDDERFTVDVEPVETCIVTINWTPDLSTQAYTNGREIYVTRGLMDRLNDEQIRTVLAHELAHCVLGHINRAALNSVAGLALDVAMLAQRVWLNGVFSGLSRDMWSIDLEREADYVSLYLLANAGFSTSDRASLWRSLADETSYAMSGFTTHPHSPERFVLLNKTHEEIEAKRTAGRPLLPEGM